MTVINCQSFSISRVITRDINLNLYSFQWYIRNHMGQKGHLKEPKTLEEEKKEKDVTVDKADKTPYPLTTENSDAVIQSIVTADEADAGEELTVELAHQYCKALQEAGWGHQHLKLIAGANPQGVVS